MVVLSVDNHAVEGPVWDAAGGLGHVGHWVVGQDTKRRDDNEIVIEVVFDGRIVVIDVELEVIAWRSCAVWIAEELCEVKRHTTAAAVKRVGILVAEDGPRTDPPCFVKHRVDVFSIERIVDGHTPDNILRVIIAVVRPHGHRVDAVVNQLGRVPVRHPRTVLSKRGDRQGAVVEDNAVGQIGDLDFNTGDKPTNVPSHTNDLGFGRGANGIAVNASRGLVFCSNPRELEVGRNVVVVDGDGAGLSHASVGLNGLADAEITVRSPDRRCVITRWQFSHVPLVGPACGALNKELLCKAVWPRDGEPNLFHIAASRALVGV